MPRFRICVLNDDFCATDDHECVDADAAAKAALQGGLDIGVGQVMRGKSFFGAEVTVHEGQQRVRHFTIAIGTSPLMN